MQCQPVAQFKSEVEECSKSVALNSNFIFVRVIAGRCRAQRTAARKRARADDVGARDNRIVNLRLVFIGDGAKHPVEAQRSQRQARGRENAQFLAEGLTLIVRNPVEEVHTAVVDVLVLIHIAVDNAGDRRETVGVAEILDAHRGQRIFNIGKRRLIFTHFVVVATLDINSRAQATARLRRGGAARRGE